MSVLVRQRCFNHLSREAVARCVTCTQYFCRECVTEHDGRMICAACLAQEVAPAATRRLDWRALVRVVQMAASLVLLVALFYLAGQILVLIPSEFHEGAIWKLSVWEKAE